MNPIRWQQIDQLFDEVSELPKERRSEFLAKKCAGDEDLKNEVLSLLEAQDKAEKFMENSAMRVMGKALAHEQSTIIDHSLIGKTLGRYKVEGMLGAGGMGEVYLAFDSVLNRKFALKILPPEFLANKDRLQRFRREAQTISALNHPNIVTIYDVGNFEDLHFIATEFIEGKTVRTLIEEGLNLDDTLSIIAQTAEALSAAHQNGVIHRDIKPENIMVRPDGYVKILDFGLAKLVEDDHATNGNGSLKTQKGMVMGTLAYMSPEQATGDHVDHRTDIWSLGVVLYEMLTGKKPFQTDDKKAAYNAILSLEPQPVSSVDNSLPPLLDSILEKFLEKDREMRYQTASDFRADLKRLRRELDSSPSISRSSGAFPVKSATKASKKTAWILSFAALFLVLAGIVGLFYYFSGRSENNIWKNAKNVPLTDQSGIEYYPSLAPDGESFVFAGKVNGDFDILLQRVGGKNVTNLTASSPAVDTQPAFSPDGKHIAFRSERNPKGIYVMEPTGENPRRICDFGYAPSWSPDGKQIVVTTDNFDLPSTRNPNDLYIVDVASGEKRLLISGYAMQPSWSPNGKRIAFWMTQNGGGRRDVATISVAGGEPVLVTNSATTNWNPVWSPDGRYLYFASDRGGNMAFWRVRIDEESGKISGEPEIVPTPAKFNHHLSFSRDGKRMIYVQTATQSNIKAIKFDANAEKTVGEPYWITRRDQGVVRPELSSDGENYVMRLSRLTQEDLAVVSRDGGNWRELTNDEYFDRYPRWSPDGKQIAFSSDRSGKYEIWLIDADGGNPRQLTFDSPAPASLPVWSPDGKRLLFDINHKSYILDLTKNWSEQKIQPLLSSETYKNSLVWDWSPDGKKLFGLFIPVNGQSHFGYYSFETGKSEKIIDGRTAITPLWLADSKRLIFSYENKIYLTDIETKRERELFSLPQDKIASVGINRENDLLYFTVSTSESDIWLLDASQNQ